MTLRLVSKTEPMARGLYADAPTPWRIVRSYSEISAVMDAQGRTLFLCPKELAGRVVAAVNLVECTHQMGAR